MMISVLCEKNVLDETMNTPAYFYIYYSFMTIDANEAKREDTMKLCAYTFFITS